MNLDSLKSGEGHVNEARGRGGRRGVVRDAGRV